MSKAMLAFSLQGGDLGAWWSSIIDSSTHNRQRTDYAEALERGEILLMPEPAYEYSVKSGSATLIDSWIIWMNWFAKLPGSTKAAPGVEMDVLRVLPRAFFVGTLMLAIPTVLLRVVLWPDTDEVKLITTVDYFTVGAVLVHWTTLITVFFGAVIVRVMKGPAYVADAYPLSDAEAPPAGD